MKRMALLQSGLVLLACLGMVIPSAALQAATPEAGSQRAPDGRAPAVTDVALDDGGTLYGQVVDGGGVAVAGAKVSVEQLDREVAAATADASGRFRVAGLRGGTYRIVAGEAVGTYRLWAARTAPPSARTDVLLVSGNRELVRGKAGGLGQRAWRFIRNPWVIAGIVAVAIAVPVAIHNSDDDGPKSST